MRRSRIGFTNTIVAMMLLVSSLGAGEGGTPLKYISSCEIDLNGDDELDIALLVETVRGHELIVLLHSEDGYTSYLLSEDKPGMFLSCHFGDTVTETKAGNGPEAGKVFDTPGAYLELAQPEGASVAYFWNGADFSEVWTSD